MTLADGGLRVLLLRAGRRGAGVVCAGEGVLLGVPPAAGRWAGRHLLHELEMVSGEGVNLPSWETVPSGKEL